MGDEKGNWVIEGRNMEMRIFVFKNFINFK